VNLQNASKVRVITVHVNVTYLYCENKQILPLDET
jgi:hypothetical protein